MYEKVSVPSRGYLFLNYKRKYVTIYTNKFPSPLGVISSLTISNCYWYETWKNGFPSPLGVISSLTTLINACEEFGIVSVPSRGYLFLNDDNETWGETDCTKFPSPLGVISSLTELQACVLLEQILFPSPLGVISSLTLLSQTFLTHLQCFRPLSGLSLP